MYKFFIKLYIGCVAMVRGWLKHTRVLDWSLIKWKVSEFILMGLPALDGVPTHMVFVRVLQSMKEINIKKSY
jgi:hypothetical protein